MPHINRIRVNNVRYNFGTQFYDDFIMRFDCKNVLYDLANGGGKSVLLLLLLQNLIPNCTLDDKQPVEKLFRGSNGSTVIHSLIEWKLDDYLVKDDYRYMLTGFCARRAREEDGQNAVRDAAAIEYFNYVIFYRHYNENDIVNLPLSDGRERITYPGLRAYLRNLPKKDYQLQVHIFERKGEYQRFISRYGLYESEWEIIRGINKTEGHVRTYFESHYRTTRKVVEDLLIEEIIQKAFAMRTSEGEDAGQGDTALMADTLYEIRDQLAELTRRQTEIHHYDRQQAVLQSLSDRIKTLDQMYQEEASLRFDIAKTWQTILLSSRTKSRDLSVAAKEKEKAAGQMEEYSRKLETVRIQSNRERLAKLSEASDNYKKELEDLEKQRAVTRDNLNLMESMNDYEDYLEEQLKYQSVSHAISHGASGQQEQLDLLKSYAGEWRRRYDQRRHELDGRILEGKQAVHLAEAGLRALSDEEREADRMLAVLDHELEKNRRQEKEELKGFGRLREQSGLLVIEEVGRALREHQRQLAETEKSLAEDGQKLEELRQQIQTFQLRQEQWEPELSHVRQEISELKDFIKSWQAGWDKIQKLLEIYGTSRGGKVPNKENPLLYVQDVAALRQQIFERYGRLACERETKKGRLLALENEIRRLVEGSPMAAPEDARRLMEYLRSCHGLTCVYGGDYLKDLDMAERRKLLERLPFLPFAVILKEGFSRVAADVLLPEKDFGSYSIPVMGLETVVSEDVPVDLEHLLFVGKGSGYYLDEKLMQREQERCRQETEELKRQLARMEDQLQTYEQDLEEISAYLLFYEGQAAERQQALAEKEAQEKEILENQQEARRQQALLENEIEEISARQQQGTNKYEALKKQCEILRQLQEVNNRLTDMRQERVEAEKRRQQLEKQQSTRQSEMERLSKEKREQLALSETAAARKENLLREWKESWQLYAEDSDGQGTEDAGQDAAGTDHDAMGAGHDDAGTGRDATGAEQDAAGTDRDAIGDDHNAAGTNHDATGAGHDTEENGGDERPWAKMSDQELQAAFMGVREAYEREHMDLADKKQLMESYARSMERLMKAITDRNQRPESLAKRQETGQLYRTDAAQIQNIRDEIGRMAERIDELTGKLAEAEAQKNRLSGSVSQAVTVVEEKYGAYKEVNLQDQSYESYVQNISRLYEAVENAHRTASANVERLTRDTYMMEGLQRDVERLMKLCHVPESLTKESWGPDVKLKRVYEELVKRHEKLQSRRFARRDAFEKDKAMAVNSLRLLGAEGLAADISEHLMLPEDARAAGQLMEDIAGTMQLIAIEKERVGKNMEALLSVKASFEEQCLQVCRNIRMELDKLSKMSVITMDGERIQMVGLSIPYIKETFYRQQMSAYIDEIVKTADSLGAQEEKLRYIRQQLAWKRLFSVIVTDMNAIRLSLYKRERIAQQSRYLRYEEAVGSTGQSQGIYIQFLIAIIHYISCIHAGASSGDSLKKVIFIDNPFGAAKDIYIWEPIFNLLKVNDVQLIVPARGATPAITGKFDVNYVLGQKLMNNRQQTIVTDYHSNVVIEEMEYVKIDYEQQVLDFV